MKPILKKVKQSCGKGEIRKCEDKMENGNHVTCLHFGGGVGACSIRQGGVRTTDIKSGDKVQIHKD